MTARTYYALDRWEPGKRLTADHVNKTSYNIETLRSKFDELALALDTEFGEGEDVAGGAATWPSTITITEQSRVETTVTQTDSGTNTHDNDIATQITATATIQGQTVTFIFNWAPP